MKKNPDFINDNLWKLLLRLSVPSILGMMVISINGLVDIFYTSYFIGTEAFTGISMLFPLMLVVTSVTVFVAVGSASVLSRVIGANQVEVQSKIIPNMIALSLIGAAMVTIPGFIFSKEIVSVLGVSGALFTYALEYYKIYILGALFSIYGLSANGLIRAEGKIRHAMQFTLISVILNIVFTPLFIGVLRMGVAGAAWSSIAAMFIYSLLTSLYFIRGKATFHTGRFQIRLEYKILKNVLSIGFSAFSIQLSNLFRQFLLFRLVVLYGTFEAMAFFNAVFRLFTFLAIPLLGLYQSMQPVIGINYGANKQDRCLKGVSIYRLAGIVLGTAIIIPILVFPETIINIMLPNKTFNEAEIFNVRMIMSILLVIPISSSSIILFQSIGKAKLATLLPVGRQLFLFVPIVLALTRYFGIEGIYYSLVLENVLYAFVLWIISEKTLQRIAVRAGL
ncbi:MATE family efflux transporter [Polaribacter cellanae]|uniref:Polysaccharide biosynthesis C-terminal domain-containing protein n=1 Tax=Polaribacter cellanae TaxID=2818493 RepID=A0A975CQ86_9FLAO|nr:MATE family efflux transporter [Polaribacter cellanae]QTE22715.1 polysaccharide biosynthesis C-terminal domain-containing protein [Polaribacter cellanae]